MPSISKADLDSLQESRDDAHGMYEMARRDADTAQAAIRKFDRILDKIKKAAQGQPLASSRDGYTSLAPHYGNYANGEPGRKIKTEERQAQEIAMLNEQVAALRSRIAAVVAVTEFAQEHKA